LDDLQKSNEACVTNVISNFYQIK